MSFNLIAKLDLIAELFFAASVVAVALSLFQACLIDNI